MSRDDRREQRKRTTDQSNFYGLEDKVAVVVLELHHLGVVVATVEDGRDAKEHGLLHAVETKRITSAKSYQGR